MMNATIDDNAVRAEAGMYFGGSLTGKSVDMGLKPRTPEEKLEIGRAHV